MTAVATTIASRGAIPATRRPAMPVATTITTTTITTTITTITTTSVIVTPVTTVIMIVVVAVKDAHVDARPVEAASRITVVPAVPAVSAIPAVISWRHCGAVISIAAVAAADVAITGIVITAGQHGHQGQGHQQAKEFHGVA
jgi:heme/copper-type cytochrome/quinol oxidase subunit 2